jgi:hypothetical protein
MKRLLAGALCALVATGANAATATWDFEADATAFRNSDNFEGTFDQVYGGTAAPALSTINGISLGASAYLDADNNGVADATTKTITTFMDAGNAGLGVCKTGFDVTARPGYGGESRCSTQYSGSPKNTGDDNLVYPEVLKLTFDTTVSLLDLVVRNGSHNLVSGNILISLDGTFDMVADRFSLNGSGEADLSALGASKMFWFTSYNEGNVARPEIYLDTLTVSTVPVPAALPLLLAGLGGFGWIGRRRKTA